MAFAADESQINTGDTSFIIISAALVLLMTPGLALFYGGMVRRKNVLSILMQCFVIMAVVSVQWVLFGYTLSFGPDINHLIGGLNWLGLKGVGMVPNADYAGTIPQFAFCAFQLMFAIITAGLIIGAFAERIRFSAFLLFIILWTTFVYDPLAHWVWGVGGWLRELGALDFAGGTVVHISSGVSGLVAALVIGKRKCGQEPMLPGNLPLTVLGASLLWFGWFGFNAGSALGANGLAALAFIVTNTAAAAGALSWIIVEWLHHGKPTTLGAVSGAVAGLVVITPAAGFVSPLASVVMGLLVSPICYLAVSKIKVKLGYDDSLDAFGIHGVGGTFGAIATGIFASKAINPLGADGLLYGGVELFLHQILAVIATYLFAGIVTFIILKVVSLFIPLRVEEEDEEAGLDITQHGENAYNYDQAFAEIAK
ncbi:ammonium transporter [Bacillota bacterium LX-D]|nr:ammonium transporter [Bacillota bacterium LX-D]